MSQTSKRSTYQPRDLFYEPKRFGKGAQRLRPAVDVKEGDARYQAAQFQHEFAHRLNRAIRDSGTSVYAYSKDPRTAGGFVHDRLARQLRGQTILQLSDLFFWSQRFEPIRRWLAEFSFGHANQKARPAGEGVDAVLPR